jgi:hypothetical protein
MAPRTNRAVVVVAVVITLLSAAVFGRNLLFGSSAVAAGPVASMAGVTVEIRGTEWAGMDHVEDGQGGFLMPDDMMPGAPTGGKARLGVRVTLVNTRPRIQEFNLLREFTLTGGLEPGPVTLTADTIGELGRLQPGTAINAVLYFDVEAPAAGEDLSPLYLNWTRGRDTVVMSVPFPGGEPAPHH